MIVGHLLAAVAQVLAGLAAHTAAAGCLPGARTLLLAGPTAVAAVLVTGRVLPRSPLLRLAAGQLAVHGVLALAACAGAGHLHTVGPVPTAMALGHVVALVACRAGLDRVVAALLRALAEVLVVRPTVLPRVPALPVVVAAPRPVALGSAPLLAAAPRRGPPARLLPA